MFPEASTLSYSLHRVVRRAGREQELQVDKGHYFVRQSDGSLRHYDWHDWIRQGALGNFDQEMFASYGAAAQTARLEAALAAFATFVGDDGETQRFVLTGVVRRNGGEPTPFRFEAKVSR